MRHGGRTALLLLSKMLALQGETLYQGAVSVLCVPKVRSSSCNGDAEAGSRLGASRVQEDNPRGHSEIVSVHEGLDCKYCSSFMPSPRKEES
jgi:hypothetical protein